MKSDNSCPFGLTAALVNFRNLSFKGVCVCVRVCPVTTSHVCVRVPSLPFEIVSVGTCVSYYFATQLAEFNLSSMMCQIPKKTCKQTNRQTKINVPIQNVTNRQTKINVQTKIPCDFEWINATVRTKDYVYRGLFFFAFFWVVAGEIVRFIPSIKKSEGLHTNKQKKNQIKNRR